MSPFVGASVMNSMSSVDPTLPDSVGPLGVWGGLAVLVSYSLVAVLVGWLTRWRRDLT